MNHFSQWLIAVFCSWCRPGMNSIAFFMDHSEVIKTLCIYLPTTYIVLTHLKYVVFEIIFALPIFFSAILRETIAIFSNFITSYYFKNWYSYKDWLFWMNFACKTEERNSPGNTNLKVLVSNLLRGALTRARAVGVLKSSSKRWWRRRARGRAEWAGNFVMKRALQLLWNAGQVAKEASRGSRHRHSVELQVVTLVKFQAGSYVLAFFTLSSRQWL